MCIAMSIIQLLFMCTAICHKVNGQLQDPPIDGAWVLTEKTKAEFLLQGLYLSLFIYLSVYCTNERMNHWSAVALDQLQKDNWKNRTLINNVSAWDYLLPLILHYTIVRYLTDWLLLNSSSDDVIRSVFLFRAMVLNIWLSESNKTKWNTMCWPI